MATKAQFKQKILLKLGGVIRPNITDEQVDASVDEAVKFYTDRVSDAVDYKYLKYLVTQQDVDRGDNSIFLPDTVVDINKVLPVRRRASYTDSGDIIANNVGMYAFNYLSSFPNQVGISDIFISKQYNEMFKSMFSSSDGFSYSKFSNRLQLDMEIGIDVVVGDYIVIYCKSLVNPETYNKMYDDRLLLNLATAYAQKYETVNLTKLSGIDMPGGVKFDVGRLEKRADDNILKYETDIDNYYRPHLGIFVS